MKATLTFYKNIRAVSISISVLGCGFIQQANSPYFAAQVFWMKVFSMIGLLAYLHFYCAQQFIFFHNLGYSRKQLYRNIIMLDFSIWIALTWLTIKVL